MSKTEKINTNIQPAKAYVDRQLEIMKKSGSVSTLSEKDYQTLVKKVARATVK